jgi:NAD(P)-dependent dehydrogenase (short-subunit alcohol dehydrogenase family)
MVEHAKKVVLVTGASAGMGKCCAGQLAGKGWRVYGVSRNIVQPVSSLRFIAMNLDVTDEHAVRQLVARIVEHEGRLDAVVNCAGFALSGAIEDTTNEEAHRQFETNFFGAATVCRQVLPIMRAQHRGTIVNVSSIAGLIPMPFQAYYSASKAALTAFTRALRLEAASFGVHVVAVEPGDFRTEFTERRQLALQSGKGAYATTFARTLEVIQAEEQKAPGPEAVAELVDHILHQDTPRASYLAGLRFQRFAVFLRKFVPARVFDHVLCKVYKI